MGVACSENVPPELLNNVGVIRLEMYSQQGDAQLKASSLSSFQQALRDTENQL
jgi:hypothetical protein